MDIFNIKSLLIAALVFVPLERAFALRREQRVFRRAFLTDLTYAVVNGIPIRAGIVLLVGAATLTVGACIPSGVRPAIAGQPLWLQVVEVVLIADLGFYWTHRAFHAVPVLWRFHSIHHSIQELDWLAGHRVHALDQAVTKAVSLAPIVVLGYSAAAVGLFAAIYHAHALLLHSNVRVGLGPLRWAIASPQFHHWHHAHEPAAHDKNFAGQLSFLDALFGTFHLPGSETPARYGIDDPVPGNYVTQMAYAFTPARRRARQDVAADA